MTTVGTPAVTVLPWQSGVVDGTSMRPVEPAVAAAAAESDESDWDGPAEDASDAAFAARHAPHEDKEKIERIGLEATRAAEPDSLAAFQLATTTVHGVSYSDISSAESSAEEEEEEESHSSDYSDGDDSDTAVVSAATARHAAAVGVSRGGRAAASASQAGGRTATIHHPTRGLKQFVLWTAREDARIRRLIRGYAGGKPNWSQLVQLGIEIAPQNLRGHPHRNHIQQTKKENTTRIYMHRNAIDSKVAFVAI